MALDHPAKLEALLFSAGEPLSRKRLCTFLGISPMELRDVALSLRERLSNRGLSLIETGDELELRTAPEASSLIQKLRESELSRELGKAGLETLAVIMYRDGATRSEIDWVRGVNSATTVRSLQLRGLISRNEDVHDRRRIRYVATTEALAHLGIESIRDLPRYEELTRALAVSEHNSNEEASA